MYTFINSLDPARNSDADRFAVYRKVVKFSKYHKNPVVFYEFVPVEGETNSENDPRNNPINTSASNLKFPSTFLSAGLGGVNDLEDWGETTFENMYPVKNYGGVTVAFFKFDDADGLRRGVVVYHYVDDEAAVREHNLAVTRSFDKYGKIGYGPEWNDKDDYLSGIDPITPEQSPLLSSYGARHYFDAGDNPDQSGIVFPLRDKLVEIVWEGLSLDNGKVYAEEFIRLNQ